jgi:hypothetical protein
MVPGAFPGELRDRIRRFPPQTLRLEIGIQTLNPRAAALIGRPGDGEVALELLRFLSAHTSAIVHLDLIAGLPGEDLCSFAAGFDRLWLSLAPASLSRVEIQVGILKLLPGTALPRHSAAYGMSYAPEPPYEVQSTAVLPRADLGRLKNFARFWELIMNRGSFPDLKLFPPGEPVFSRFMELADRLLARFGKNWGIDRKELGAAISLVSENLPRSRSAGRRGS